MKFLSQAMSIVALLLFISISSFAQRTESSAPSAPPLDGIYKKDNVENRRTLSYDPVREADVFWEKSVWRVIDVREKMNKHFVYPKAPLAQMLFDAITEGQLTAYDAENDEFKNTLSTSECNNLVYSIDTITAYDPVTFEPEINVVRNVINWEDIKRFRIKEVWYFDEELGTLKTRIIGIAPLREVYDNTTGDFKFEIPMFWIYYPHARDFLAKQKVFNPMNDANPMSWEDMLEMRYFASYIYKESNIYDRRIKDHKAGIDELLEARRIKDEIFNIEQDLWSK